MFVQRCVCVMIAVALCLALGTGSARAQTAGHGLKSETGLKLAEMIDAGIPFEGMTASLDGASVWPGFLFIRWNGDGSRFDGHIEWTSLSHVNYVEGTITETGDFVEVDFTSTKVLVQGNAAHGVVYHSIAALRDGQLTLLGKWSSGDHRGPFAMSVASAKAGQQSSLLGGTPVDEALAGQAEEADDGKPTVIWREDAIDWKIDGFQYPNGDRFVKLSCSWARDRLAGGATPGEMMIIVTNLDDSPILAYRFENHINWNKQMGELTHIDIYFSEKVQYHLPVAPQSNGWVYSTDPAMVKRIIMSTDKDAQHIDSDMIVETGIPGLLRNSMLTAYISTKSLIDAWTAAGYFMRGETVPSMIEIMEARD